MLQREALAILKTGANVFLTGEPGAGKTHTTNAYVSWLRSHGIEPAITASTGIAATHIGGMTIHSWSGIGIAKTVTAQDVDRIAQNKKVASRILQSTTLIIDEVSMLSDAVLSMVDIVCKEVRRNQQPFGGLQVVLVGDFFQLPPVVRQTSAQTEEVLFDEESYTPFAFRASAWRAIDPMVCYLTEQHRQSDDVFLGLLNAVRTNTAGENEKSILRTRYAKEAHKNTTRLFTHNADVDRINNDRLRELQEDEHEFVVHSRGPEHLVASLIKNCLSPETLILKEGARVMFTKNDLEHRYVNGTLGTVTGFDNHSGYPIVRTAAGRSIVAEPDEWRIDDAGRTLASITQVPLRLAWAITVHKSQGMSLDAAHMDLSHVFEYGQGYVALSRVRTLSGLTISGLNDQALQVHPEAYAKDQLFREASVNAAHAFAAMPEQELTTMHAQFITASGGKECIQEKTIQPDRHAVSKQVRKQKPQRGDTYTKTLELLQEGKSVDEISKVRGLVKSTIWGHVHELYTQKKLSKKEVLALAPKDFQQVLPRITKAFKTAKDARLKTVFAMLGGVVSYDYLRLARILADT